MALGAVLGGRRMKQFFSWDGFLVGMALQAQGEDCGPGQIYTGDVIGDTHFMAGKTARLDRRMDRLCFELALVAFEALCTVSIYI